MRHKNFVGLTAIAIAIAVLSFCNGDSGRSLADELAGLNDAYGTSMKAIGTAEEKAQVEKDYLMNIAGLVDKYAGKKLSAADELARGEIYEKLTQFGKADAIFIALIKDGTETLKCAAYKKLTASLIRQNKLDDANRVLREVKEKYKGGLAPFAGLFLRAGVNQRNSDPATALEFIDVGLGFPIEQEYARSLYYAVHIKFVDGGLDYRQMGEFLLKMKELYGDDQRIDEQIAKKELFLAFIGSDAPDFTADGSWINSGEPLSIKKMKGKYVLLDFFAPWCPDCRNSLPKFLELGEKLKGKMDVIMVTRLYGFYADENTSAKRGIKPEEELELLKEYFKMKEIAIPAFVSNNEETHDNFAASAIPHYVLVSPEGKVVKLCMERVHDFFTEVEELVNN